MQIPFNATNFLMCDQQVSELAFGFIFINVKLDSLQLGWHPLFMSLTVCRSNVEVNLYHKNDSKVTVVINIYITSTLYIIFLLMY